jgi:hypothetical protein
MDSAAEIMTLFRVDFFIRIPRYFTQAARAHIVEGVLQYIYVHTFMGQMMCIFDVSDFFQLLQMDICGFQDQCTV